MGNGRLRNDQILVIKQFEVVFDSLGVSALVVL
jgi:hypothetical protein